ncbi:septal ring lytic transglycosylase RlpA family protein [Labilibaculum sp. K2S]|uniref:septal ring lytic transglycosylase RlpA family protein n=1 Tax=Labilibaculum sp. K2S TaxID=3056386 RepID=UPI0025A45DBE|nr:septal ring lytic transglycosylase RlpA family protein [Labilibaculum sp. K2S]MDM8161130.1 septal ring lytic transglycosylase RlpA family protein [Labilibaculum sp. K2S]
MMFRLSMIICFTLLQFNLHAQKPHKAVQIGKASFYADRFEGKRTACGEIYHHENYTAAHRSLPFGTWVKVVNLDNKKVVIVRINDRGPYAKGRIIDLSKSASKEINAINQGIFSVSVEVYQKDPDMIPIQYIFNPISLREQMLFGF